MYGFSAVLVLNRVSILASLSRVWFLHFSLELGMLFGRSYFYIITDQDHQPKLHDEGRSKTFGLGHKHGY